MLNSDNTVLMSILVIEYTISLSVGGILLSILIEMTNRGRLGFSLSARLLLVQYAHTPVYPSE